MKFAKYLDENCIPEWKAAYFDYKKGKKLIKRVHAQSTSHDRSRRHARAGAFGSPSTPLVNTSPRSAEHLSYGAMNNGPSRSATESSTEAPHDTAGDRSHDMLDLPPPSLPMPTASPTSRKHAARRRAGLVSSASATTSGTTPQPLRFEDIELVPENEAQLTFYSFVESEIRKVDEFYTSREVEAGKRLAELRYQLNAMKDRKKALGDRRNYTTDERKAHRSDYTRAASRAVANVRSFFSYADADLLTTHPIDDNPKQDTATQLVLTYRVARRRLRIAIQEFYHSLELLSSYRTLNRTALTKVLKKFDKTARARSSTKFLRLFNDRTYIGTSEFLDKMMHDSEDVYAKYFYHGDRKHAITALRTKEHTEDYRFTMLRIGLYFGLSIVLGLEGLVRSQVSVPDDVQRSFILQVFGAFFFLILISLLFGLNSYIWSKNKVNYVFIFEFDVRHNLNWIQYLEIPAVIGLLFSLCFWMCFSDFFPKFTTWYPLLFVGLSAIALLAPIPTFHLSTRRWLINAHGRLLISGISSVRFQDVFLGDLYNSLTYSAGNTALFFCIYRWNWNDPARCGSGRSVLLGFFTTLPGILRLFQCFRRFYDTRHYFPHLVNAGKYTCTILQYMCLSLWRIHSNERFKILYIIFAILNSIYTATWDVVMDVSLLQPGSKAFLLRNDRAFKYTWAYYAFLILDPILRCSWIFYLIYENDKQHAAALSFYVGLAEVFRRTMWSCFRVENEHVANVSTYRATRELPLPYAHHTPEEIEAQERRSGNVSKTRHEPPGVAEAHATDFERKNVDGMHLDDVVVDSEGSDEEPPSGSDTPEDTDPEQ